METTTILGITAVLIAVAVGKQLPDTLWQRRGLFKRALWFLAIGLGSTGAFGLAATAARADGPNLLQNPSVETAASGGATPQAWSSSRTGVTSTRLVYKTDGGRTGSRSLLIEKTSSRSGTAMWIPTAVTVKPRTQYRYSAYYKASAGTDVILEVTGAFNIKFNYTLSRTAANTGDWKQLSYTFTTSSSARKVTVYHRVYQTGWLQTDDFSLAEVNASDPAPTVSLTAPLDGATVGGSLTTTATATNAVGVQFKVDGANLGAEDASSPYQANWNTTDLVNCSNHVVSAVARNGSGQSASSSATVNVRNGSTVRVASPANGTVLTGTATVSAEPVGQCGLLGVKFQVDGNDLGAEIGAAPYIATLDTTTLSNGVHTLVAIGRDGSGTTTASVNFEVQNVTPEPLNPVQIENGKPGDRSWFSGPFDFASNREIEGYTSQASVQAGAGNQIAFFVNVPDVGRDPEYTLTIYRLGWYGGTGARKMTGPITLPSITQAAAAPNPANGNIIVAGWRQPYQLTVPDDWVSGVYIALLVTKNTSLGSYVPFIVRNDNRPAQYVHQSPVTSWQAYNCWGGMSLYNCADFGGRSDTARKVSFDRPYHVVNHGLPYEFDKEMGLIRFLEREGYDVTYQTSIDTHVGDGGLSSHKAFLSAGHDEYWTREMRSNVEQALARGVSLAFFGSNAMYWQIRLEDANRTVVGYKEFAQVEDPYATDGLPGHLARVTTRWRDAPVSQPENAVIGIMYHGDPCHGDVIINDGGAAGTFPTHWIYSGISTARNGEALPGLLGNECDSLYAGAPEGIEIVARSPDPFPEGDAYHANMSVYSKACTAGNCANPTATVFATGTLQWAWGLDSFQLPPVQNETARQMTRNVLARFVGKTVEGGATSPNGDHF